MDRKGSIRETELARVSNYDKALSDEIQGIVRAVEEFYNEAQKGNWLDATTYSRW